MNIVPARLHEQVTRVERNHALAIGIATGLTALWSVYRLFWLFYSATVLSGVGLSPAAMVFPIVLWGAVGVSAGVVSFAFLTHYAKHS